MLSRFYNFFSRAGTGYGTEEPVPTDELDNLQSNLLEKMNELEKKLKEWRDIERDIIASAPELALDFEDLTIKETIPEKIKNIFVNFLQEIKELMQPASQELEEINKTARPHLMTLYRHTLDLLKKLNSPEPLPEPQQTQIKFDICKTNITILTESKNMLDKIYKEITFCLKSEKLAEGFAIQLINRFLALVLDTNFDWSDQYRHLLLTEIDKAECQTEETVTAIEGMLDKAALEVKSSSTLFQPAIVADAIEPTDQVQPRAVL